MSSEPAKFRPSSVKTSLNDPIPDLVNRLEKLLADAKTGRLRFAAWAVVYSDDTRPDSTIGNDWAGGKYVRFAAGAAVSRLFVKWYGHEEN